MLQKVPCVQNSKKEWTGVPLIAANMDTTGTFEMAERLAKHHCLTAVHKYYSVDDWSAFATANPTALDYIAASSGTGSSDFSNLTAIVDAVPGLNHICLDVANGYSEAFVDFVRKAREAFPRHTIMAGQ